MNDRCNPNNLHLKLEADAWMHQSRLACASSAEGRDAMCEEIRVRGSKEDQRLLKLNGRDLIERILTLTWRDRPSGFDSSFQGWVRHWLDTGELGDPASDNFPSELERLLKDLSKSLDNYIRWRSSSFPQEERGYWEALWKLQAVNEAQQTRWQPPSKEVQRTIQQPLSVIRRWFEAVSGLLNRLLGK